MIIENDTNIGADTASMKDMLSRLVELFAEASGSLSTIGQQLAATAGSGTPADGLTAVTNGASSSPPLLPELPETFSAFLTDAFTGEGLFEKSEKEKGEGDDDAEKAEKVKALSKETSKSQIEADKEQKNSDKKLWASKLANAIAGSKKLAKVNKAYNIAQTIASTANGIIDAFSGPPGFPLNIAVAAGIAATGAKQLATIKGQTHDGLDQIPSTGTYLLEKGERVVGKRLNQDLSSFLGAAGGSGGGANNSVANFDRSTNSNSTFNPTINLTIGDGASEDAVFANRGAVETMIRDIYADYAQASPFSA